MSEQAKEAPALPGEEWRDADDDSVLLAVTEHQRDALLRAILDAAIAAGICRPDVAVLDGPSAIMLCGDLAGAVKHERARAERAEADYEAMSTARLERAERAEKIAAAERALRHAFDAYTQDPGAWGAYADAAAALRTLGVQL